MICYTLIVLATRQLERIVKGFANHRRIQIMNLLSESPELSLQDIANRVKINVKTASEHVRRLAISGLVLKRHRGSEVLHKLSPSAEVILKFLRKLE